MKSRNRKPIKLLRNSSKLGRDIVAIAGLTTLVISPSLTIDAFNPPKFALLVTGVTYLGFRYWKEIIQGLERRVTLFILLSLFATLLLTLIANRYSISERLFGIAGRNFGFITLLALTLLGLYSFQASRRKLLEPRHILNGLALTNIGVSLVFSLQESGFIFTDFKNDYTILPSTLGNPNFLSAYLGISVLAVLNWIFQNRHKTFTVLLGIIISSYSIYVIFVSGSIQGLLALGISLLALFLIFSLSYFNKILNLIIFFFLAIASLILVSSFLGEGYLGERFAQRTLQNRLEYWEIAVRIALDSPFFGKGYDSYLDYYRSFVRNSNFENLGGPVISDSPHNIFLDSFVSGGLFLGLSFLSLIFLTLLRGSIRISENVKLNVIDSSMSSLFSIFLAFIAICFISPFQIGVLVWLPIIVGALLGLNSSSDVNHEKECRVSHRWENKAASVALSASILVCNPIFALFPLATEIRFRTAVEESSFAKLSNVAVDWPFSGYRAISISQGFLDSSLNLSTSQPNRDELIQLEALREGAFEIALKTVKINPRQVEGWSFLLRNANDSVIQDKARRKLQELDPINPLWRLLP